MVDIKNLREIWDKHCFDKRSNKIKFLPRIEALHIVMAYALFGISWTLLSDKLIGIFVKNPEITGQIELYKGWFFIFITGLFFYFVIEKILKRIELNGNDPIRMAGSHADITESVKLQESVRKDKELLEKILIDSSIIYLFLDRFGTIKNVNPFFEKITGFSRFESCGKNIVDLLIPEDQKPAAKRMLKTIVNNQPVALFESAMLCKNGANISCLWSTNRIYDETGSVQKIACIGLDITDRIARENQLYTMVYYDTLTKLPNRLRLEEEAEEQLRIAEKEGTRFAVIYFEIDNFKHINDSIGHETGDKILVQFVDLMNKNIPAKNKLGRISGGQFCMLMTQLQSENDLIAEINLIFELLRKPIAFDERKFYISISLGAAIYPNHGTTWYKLVQNAEAAMFYAKENGKNRYFIYSMDAEEKSQRFFRLSNQLRWAIENDKFLLYYQPQIELETGKIVGVEALIRLEINGEIISPAEFIPFAEENGFIEPIEKWVIRNVFAQKKEWDQKGFPRLKMCINLSAKTVAKEPRYILKMLREYDLDCLDIELEITETAIMADFDKAIFTLNGLEKEGFSISLDDFGTGYSSLTYLQNLPIKTLKIDREFIKNIMSENEESYIFKSIVDLTHNLGLTVVAEGVETKEQLEFIRKNKCDIAQGYYFSKPVPASEIESTYFQETEIIV